MIYESYVYASIRACMHAIPFIMWQVACLFVLFFMVYTHRITWSSISLCIGISIMLAVGYYERAQQWLVISRDAVGIYLGPGVSYPRQGNLQARDKVRVLGVRDGWSQVEHNGVIGWIDNAQS